MPEKGRNTVTISDEAHRIVKIVADRATRKRGYFVSRQKIVDGLIIEHLGAIAEGEDFPEKERAVRDTITPSEDKWIARFLILLRSPHPLVSKGIRDDVMRMERTAEALNVKIPASLG